MVATKYGWYNSGGSNPPATSHSFYHDYISS